MYDIEKIYDDMENYLIENIKRNLTSDLTSFHLKEEKKLGFDWEAWQSSKLRSLKEYRKQNKTIINKYLNNIDEEVAAVLRRESRQGKLDAFKGYKKALGKGHKSSVKIKDSFFKVNGRKVDALIKSVNNDFKTANRAVLRMSNDQYRQIIHEASMYVGTGVMTEEQAIKKSVNDFQTRGINCIEYSNGARHTISNYSKMAIRTASTRAYLTGEGEFRKKIGETLVIISKHGTACKLCQPFEGKVLIDDIYSGGSSKDGNHMLLSEAMKQGLYHPNCRHGMGTYYGDLGKEESEEIAEEVEKDDIELKKTQEVAKEEQKAAKTSKKKVDLDGIEIPDKKPVTRRQRRTAAVKDVIEEASGHATGETYKRLSEAEIENMQAGSNKAYSKFDLFEENAINEYTMGAYQDINDYLNEKYEGFDGINDMIEHIDSAMDNYELEEDVIAYRGANKQHYNSLHINDEFVSPMYNSTSLNENIANTFMEDKKDPYMLEIRVPKGTKSLYVGDNAAYEFEAELLLGRGTKYKVIDIQEEKMILEVIE